MDHGTYYDGTKGVTFTDQYCGGARIIPESKHKETKYPAPTLPRAKHGHQAAFLNACKGGEPACSNFDYSGPLAEIVLLVDIATRIKKPFTFRLKELKAVYCPEADDRQKYEASGDPKYVNRAHRRKIIPAMRLPSVFCAARPRTMDAIPAPANSAVPIPRNSGIKCTYSSRAMT